jgi:hypothetical protein
MTSPPARYTLRDLPLAAKLVLSAFLVSVGIGYLWAMAQIHFKHASAGNPMPTVSDMVERFSGVPWPLEPKPDVPAEEKKVADLARAEGVGVGIKVRGAKIQTLIFDRCGICHSPGGEKEEYRLDNYDGIAKYLEKTPSYPAGHLHTAITADRKAKWDKENMVPAFFEKSDDWRKLTATPEAMKKIERQRDLERLAFVAWLEAGAPKAPYDADAFPLPNPERFSDLTPAYLTEAPPLLDKPAAKPDHAAPVDKWKAAKRKQLSIEALTQSTHAHLLSFAVLWACTGLIFAFTSYPSFLRCFLSPLVLVVQVIDVGCWWLARLEPPAGPYFALAVLGTGTIVGLGLGAQIVLSLFNMYGLKGKAVLVLVFLAGAGAFGVTYAKVIAPQLEAERAVEAGNGR